MKLMTSDEIIEELQKLAYQSNGLHKKLSPEDKENFKDLDLGRTYQLETRLTEVTKENKTLIDELQDKKFELYKLSNNFNSTCQTYDQVEIALEDKITNALKKMGSNKKHINCIQSIINETMENFRNKIVSESDLDV